VRLANDPRPIETAGEGGSRPSFSSGKSRFPTRLALSTGKLLLSAGLIGYLLYHHGLNHQRFEGIDPVLSAITVAIFVFQIAVNTVRWRLILMHVTGTGRPYRRLFGIYYASAFFSQVLPSIGGDLVRVLYGRTLGSTSGPIIISVLVDRGIALTALLFAALPSLLFLAPFDPARMVLRSVGLVAGSGLAAAYGCCLIARAMRRWRIWTDLPQWIQTLVASGDWSLTSRTGLCRLIPLSAFVHLLSIAAVFLAAHAVHVPLSLPVVLAIGPILLLAQVLPISIGGWGVREAAAVALLAMTGVNATSALLVSIMFGILLILATLPGVLFWLMLRDPERGPSLPCR
jgi:glycosyltransferase 2 family protein